MTISTNNNKKLLIDMAASAAAGFITALTIITISSPDGLETLFDRFVTASLLTLGMGYLYYLFLPSAWERYKQLSIKIKIWTLLLAILSAILFSSSFGIFSVAAIVLASFIFVVQGAENLQSFVEKKKAVRFIIAWACAGVVSFYASGFFKNFYTSDLSFIFIAVITNISFTLLFNVLIEGLESSLDESFLDRIVSSGILLLGVTFLILSIRLLVRYPDLFSTDFFLPHAETIPYFVGLTILAQSWTAYIYGKIDSIKRISIASNWIKRNAPGVLLASFVSAATYLYATVFVTSDLGLVDNYFDADSPLWVNFLVTPKEQIHAARAVHPLILMMLRPPIWFISLFLNGDRFHAALLLNVSAGAVCILLIWMFFKQRTSSTSFALILGALLGLSNAHLLLSTFFESYIFSALFLISSVFILHKEHAPLKYSIPVGLAAFGITITNFIQTCILFLFTQRSIKETVKYVFITIALATVLAFAQSVFEPNAPPFYILKNLTRETVFQRDTTTVPLKETISRANVMARTFTLFSVVAPRPLVLLEEIGCTFPCFNTIRFFGGKYQYASYIGFGSFLARTWFGLLIISGLVFLWKLFKSPKHVYLQIALALNILFNFFLHMNYGDDPQLYTPNWTYAIVFFFGLSYETFLDKKWIKPIMLLFLCAVLFNNIELFHKMLDAILPFAN